MRIFRDSDEAERSTMETTAPSIFEDLAQILKEYLIIAACRITDPANDGRKNENFTIEMFVKGFASDPKTTKELHVLHQRMQKLRDKVKPARDKARGACRSRRRSQGKAAWAGDLCRVG